MRQTPSSRAKALKPELRSEPPPTADEVEMQSESNWVNCLQKKKKKKKKALFRRL